MLPSAPRASCRGFTFVELVVVVLLLTFFAFGASGLVSGARISSDGPRGLVELGLVATLVRFAGLAVLLFGAGFWYLAELRDPGRLDTFRLGHFLLLALTYSLFFATFAVLGSHGVTAWLAVGIAACVSYPLLVMHVATVVDLRFALTSALPLAIVTTAIVVNGTYGGSVQAFVHLGIACAAVAVTTCTYPRLAAGRQRRRAQLEQQLAHTIDQLSLHANGGRAAIAAAKGALALQDPPEFAASRSWVEQRVRGVDEVLASFERLVHVRDTAVRAASGLERHSARNEAVRLARRLEHRLPGAVAALREATHALAAPRTARTDATERAGSQHCIACGAACHGARFCPACGTRCAEARHCRRCAHVLRVPIHLLVPAAPDATQETHCDACGERHCA